MGFGENNGKQLALELVLQLPLRPSPCWRKTEIQEDAKLCYFWIYIVQNLHPARQNSKL